MNIYFQKGERAGESLKFDPPGVFIGREKDNDIQLLVDGVSQYHAKILYDAKLWVIYDLKSRNGTRVNGKKVKNSMPLNSGDMIYIAKEALKIEYDEKENVDNILDLNNDDGIRIKSPEEAKKRVPPKETPRESCETKTDITVTHKSKEQKAREREINRMIQEILKKKKKRLTIISIIIAIIANAIIFWWWHLKTY